MNLQTEISRLKGFETAYRIWDEKTQWVQDAEWSFPVLGMHRADVMRTEIERLRAELAEHLETMLECETAEQTDGPLEGWLDLMGEEAAMEAGDRLVELGFYERQSFTGRAFYRKKVQP